MKAHVNRDKSGDFYAAQFQQVQKLAPPSSERDRNIPDLLAKMCLLEAFRLVDIGCGLGKVARCAKDMFPQAIISGVDISTEIVEKARGFRPDIDYRVGGGQDLPFEDSVFDFATCRMSIHHYPKVSAHLREVRRVLKPEGAYLIMDIVPEDAEQAERLNEVFLAAERESPGDGHVRFYTLSEYAGFLDESGFVLDEVVYSPFFVTWSKTKDYYRSILRHIQRMPHEFQRQIGFDDKAESFTYILRMGNLFCRSNNRGNHH